MLEPTNESQGDPTAADVLRALLNEDVTDIEAPDKITIERATNHQYACRVYPQGQDDFDGVLITFQEGL